MAVCFKDCCNKNFVMATKPQEDVLEIRGKHWRDHILASSSDLEITK